MTITPTRSTATAALLTLSLSSLALAAPATAAPSSKGPQGKSATAKAKKAKAKKRSAKKLSAADPASALAALPTYTGPTGAVVHTKAVTVSFNTSSDPQEQRSFTRQAESWTELGGGQRERTRWGATDPDTGVFVGQSETWSSPRFDVLSFSGAPAAVGIFCSARSTIDRFDDAAVLEARGDISTLPAGPAIDGAATRVLTRELFAGFTAGPKVKYFYDAASGEAVRKQQLTSQGSVLFETDYALWEELPAGGSAAELSAAAPTDATFVRQDGRPLGSCLR